MPDLYILNGVRYFRLYFACPVCRERGKNTPPAYWTHAGCGGDIYIGSNATYYCPKCDNVLPVGNWKYQCPYHSTSKDEYVSLLYGDLSVAETLGTCLQFVESWGTVWLRELLANLKQ